MASHDGASSSSSSSVSSFTHDVFLSFRGPDTGDAFTAFLHKHLVKEGVDVYIDREDLRAGEEIKSALFKAIQGSKISIPIFSKGYADSRWCLDELVEIVRCHTDNRQIILPIFFDVDPTDVRHQTGSFKTSFDKHKDKDRFDEQTINSWKEALEEVADISGYDLGKVTGNQSKLVDLVVERVLCESSGKRLADVNNPVGLDARVKEVKDRLCIGSNDVQFVGIWGTGGIGKTTIAKTLYNRIFKSFRRSCFLADIKGEEASGPKGLVHLQEQLIYSISKWKVDGNIGNVYRGRQLIIEKLRGENVLLILDDVGSHSQLDALAIECNLFGPGSRIIITSRDKHILELAKVDEDKIYCPTELDRVQSLQLFSLHAFSSDRPPEEYLQLSLDVTNLAGGLPLTLEVLGSTFSDKENREEEVWKSMLQELKRIPHDKVFEKLKISYDSLTDHEKSIFLDAACFFVGRKKETLISVWDACGFNPILAIKKLTQRSLLKFIPASFFGETYDVLRMHDQIRAMGRHIVHKESPTEPSKRSRLWSYEDILEVLEEPQGAQMLEVIYKRRDYLQPLQPLPHRPNFAMMSKLRVLHICEIQSKGDFPHLPPNLRCFSWSGLRVPANFYHKKLVRMDISNTQIGEAWTNKPHNENQRFQKLKVLILKGCDVSYKSFDFSWFPYLETLDLECCKNMVDLHKSIGDLKSLVKLNLGWTNIKELPNSICSLSTLKVLTLEGCFSLENLPESIGELKSLVKLMLENTGIKELPNSICRLSSLEVLQGCVLLENLPESIGDLKSLVKLELANAIIEELPNSICSLSSLTVLTLRWCSSLLPKSIGDLKSLVELELDNRIIEELPNSICRLSSLRVLTLSGCFALKNLPESIGDLKSLVKLDLGFTNIEEIPSSICKLSSLTWLSLHDCKSLNKLPNGVWLLEKLEELSATDCPKLVELPTSWGRMRCLRIIDLTRTMILLPRENSVMLPSLVKLHIGNDLESSLPPWISGLPRLQHLVLEGHTNLKSLPDLPSTLTSLTLQNCISLQTLPDLSSLSHLASLHIQHCKQLKVIQGLERIVESLEELEVMGCKYLVDTPRWKIHGQGTLLVDKISWGVNNILVDEISQLGIDIYSSNVNDGIYKGLILCVVFELPPTEYLQYHYHVQEGQLVDICLFLEVSIRRRKDGRIIKLSHDVVIEGVKYTSERDIIYVHHFKGFDWFGIPLEPGIDAIVYQNVFGFIESPPPPMLNDNAIECEVKFWEVWMESMVSEQQQEEEEEITNQEDESPITAAKRMVADFFRWSCDDDHGSTSSSNTTRRARKRSRLDHT